jgi:hypothetical protein
MPMPVSPPMSPPMLVRKQGFQKII